MNKFLRTVLILLVASAFLYTHSTTARAQDATVKTFFFEGEPNVLDPQAASTLDEFNALYNIYEGLVTYDPETLEPKPLLAESWKVSDDGKVYTFTLRKGVKFHNGRAMTADDVKYSLERLGNPKTGTSYTSLMLNQVKGFSAMRAKENPATALEGVKAVDANTVEITLNAPVGSFLKQLTMPGGFVVAKEAAEGKDFAQNPVGTGPYKLKEWKRQTSLTLEANADYWGGAPAVKSVVIRTSPGAAQQVLEYEANNADTAVVPEPELARLRDDEKLSKELKNIPILSTFFFRVNLKDPVMSKPEVRQALAIAINREAIIKTVLAGKGSPAYGLYPPGLSAFNKDYIPFARDIAKAKALLEKAGYKDGVDIEVRTGQVETELRVLNAIQQQVAEAGIRLKINSTEKSIYDKDRGECKMQLGTISFSQDYADADNFTPQLYRASGALQICGYDSYPGVADVKALLDKGSALPLGKERDEVYQQAEKLGIDAAVIIPIYHGTRTVLVNPRLKGIVVDNNSVMQFARLKVG
jgi:ABC-type transport system substrate-binding protein